MHRKAALTGGRWGSGGGGGGRGEREREREERERERERERETWNGESRILRELTGQQAATPC